MKKHPSRHFIRFGRVVVVKSKKSGRLTTRIDADSLATCRKDTPEALTDGYECKEMDSLFAAAEGEKQICACFIILVEKFIFNMFFHIILTKGCHSSTQNLVQTIQKLI